MKETGTHSPNPKRSSLGSYTVGAVAFSLTVIGAMVLLNRSASSDRRPAQPRELQPTATELATSPAPADAARAPTARKTSAPIARATNRTTTRASEPAKAAAVTRPSTRGDVPDDYVAPAEAATSDVTRVAEAVDALSAANDPPPVTITGCLEMSTTGDQFRLTETEGGDAPKSRGWRTGFLKARAVPVTLISPPDGAVLKANVGKRVAATGLLTSRELTVRTVRVVDVACD